MDKPIQKPEGSFISYFSNLVKEKGGINLAQGIPGFQPPDELLQSLQSILNQNVHQYAPGIGNFKLIEVLQSKYSKDFSVVKDNFLIVQGATEALSLVYTYINKLTGGAYSTLSFEPAYESYSQLPKIFSQNYIDFPLNNDYCVDYDQLTATIRIKNVKVVFIASPGNPYGKVWSEREITKLIELAEKFSFYLIFDGVYKDLYFNSPTFLPLKFDSPNVFYVNSFSKMLCITGWRVGYLYAHEIHRKGLRSIHDYIGLCAPSLLQEALVKYLNENNFGEEFVNAFRDNVRKNFFMLSEALTKLNFAIPPIDGGCFIWAKLPYPFTDGFDFAHKLYQSTGVATIPGEHFSANHKSWIRLNIARSEDEISKAINLLSHYISNH